MLFKCQVSGTSEIQLLFAEVAFALPKTRVVPRCYMVRQCLATSAKTRVALASCIQSQAFGSAELNCRRHSASGVMSTKDCIQVPAVTSLFHICGAVHRPRAGCDRRTLQSSQPGRNIPWSELVSCENQKPKTTTETTQSLPESEAP